MRLTTRFAAATAAAGILMAHAAAASQQAKPFPIKVFLLSRTTLLSQDSSGLVTPKRSSLEPFEVEIIQGAVRDFANQVKASSGGMLEPRLSIEEDQEHIACIHQQGPWSTKQEFSTSLESPADNTLVGQMLRKGIAPRVNKDLFQANDGVYRGPYGVVFVIHSSLAPVDANFTIDGSPGRLIGWHTFTNKDPKTALTRTLLESAHELAGIPLSPQRPEPPPVGPYGYGEVEFSSTDGVFKLISTGVIARGGARIASLEAGQTPILKFRAVSTTREPMALNLFGAKGAVASILLKGQRPGDEASLMAPYDANGGRIQASEAGTDFVLDLRQIPGWESVTEVHIGPPATIEKFEKGPPEKTAIQISAFSAAGAGEGALTIKVLEPSPEELDLRSEIAILRGSQTLSDSEWAKALAMLSSENARIRFSTAAAFLIRKEPRAVPALAEMAASALVADSFIACQALAAQDSGEARAALSLILKKGPFDTNRRFAAEAVGSSPSPADVPLLNMMMLQRGWRGRLAAAQGLSGVASREAQVILTASMAHEQEPNPLVRLTIASKLDPTFELSARRLLYTAVNDPSNWVRAAAYSRLLAAPFDSIRSEAIKGVKDDSPSVRVYLLKAMAGAPSPAFRTALRQAVADSLPDVRAAALDALTAQADPVSTAEIENTFADPSSEVQLALVRMAAARKITLPVQVIQALKSSPHESVRTAAANL